GRPCVRESALSGHGCSATKGNPKKIARFKVMPNFIGFSQPSVAAQKPEPSTQFEVGGRCTPSNDPAHMSGRPAWAVPICTDRHNFATDCSTVQFVDLCRMADVCQRDSN